MTDTSSTFVNASIQDICSPGCINAGELYRATLRVFLDFQYGCIHLLRFCVYLKAGNRTSALQHSENNFYYVVKNLSTENSVVIISLSFISRPRSNISDNDGKCNDQSWR